MKKESQKRNNRTTTRNPRRFPFKPGWTTNVYHDKKKYTVGLERNLKQHQKGLQHELGRRGHLCKRNFLAGRAVQEEGV